MAGFRQCAATQTDCLLTLHYKRYRQQPEHLMEHNRQCTSQWHFGDYRACCTSLYDAGRESGSDGSEGRRCQTDFALCIQLCGRIIRCNQRIAACLAYRKLHHPDLREQSVLRGHPLCQRIYRRCYRQLYRRNHSPRPHHHRQTPQQHVLRHIEERRSVSGAVHR